MAWAYTAAAGFVGDLSLVESAVPGTLRNNFSGRVGMKFTVGEYPLTVTSLGRWAVAGNSNEHALFLVRANDQQEIASTRLVLSANGPVDTFVYAPLSTPVILEAAQSYYLVSEETNAGDLWADLDSTVTPTTFVQVDGFVYFNELFPWIHVPSPNQTFGPVDLRFLEPAVPPMVRLLQPPDWHVLSSGENLLLTAETATNAMRVDFFAGGTKIGESTTPPHEFLWVQPPPGQVTLSARVTDEHGVMGTSRVARVTMIVPQDQEPFVQQTLVGRTRNDFSGWVGMMITVGPEPLVVSSLGRMSLEGNTQEHDLKLVQLSFRTNGNTRIIESTDLAQARIAMTNRVPGEFAYATLDAPVVLLPNTSYVFLSAEELGGDTWHELDTEVFPRAGGSINGAVYVGANGYVFGGETNRSYVPLNFHYSISRSPAPRLRWVRTEQEMVLWIEGLPSQLCVVESSTDLTTWIEEARRVLPPEGTIALTIQNSPPPLMRFYRAKYE